MTAAERPMPVDLKATKPAEGEREHLLLQENAPPDMTGYVLCAACVFFLANPLFGALAFILAGKHHAFLVTVTYSDCTKFLGVHQYWG